MYSQLTKPTYEAGHERPLDAFGRSAFVRELTNEQLAEVLTFLAARPLHTAFMTSLILDNGLVNPLNRGTFYACRNAQGELEGVALIGHSMLFEAQTDAAVEAFARVARQCSKGHISLGEQERVEYFWQCYEDGGQTPRLFAREILFEARWPVMMHEAIPQLRPARLEDMPLLMPVHARMAYAETGINPLATDPHGFRLRMARRIGQRRVWVWIEDDRLIFKADVIADTPHVNYLEGVYVAPEQRRQGYGQRCLSQLTRNLLTNTNSVTLLVNEENAEAVRFYQQPGFKARSCYDTVILKK